MRRFLVVFDELEIRKMDVKTGRNSPETVTAARCVNVGLFVSGNLRRDAVVSLARKEKGGLSVVSFKGVDLRRVSPDERSISFFLLKAFDAVDLLERGESRKMDNGIENERGEIESLLEAWSIDTVFLATTDCEKWPSDVIASDNALYIYDSSSTSSFSNRIHSRVIPVPRPPHPERFLLDLNLMADWSS